MFNTIGVVVEGWVGGGVGVGGGGEYAAVLLETAEHPCMTSKSFQAGTNMSVEKRLFGCLLSARIW